MTSEFPMIPYSRMQQDGYLPLRKGPVRFAVGPPDGLTSNSWRIWTGNGNVYIACRDNFKETKVSLHSPRWRMGFTSEAIQKNKNLLSEGQNRAWDVWDEPMESLPGTIVAFRLLFPSSELAVRPDQRSQKAWANVIYIEAAPPGKLTVVTIFITVGDVELSHESEPSFCLASLDIGNGRYAKIIAHGDPELNFQDFIEQAVAASNNSATADGIKIPKTGYGYFLGKRDDGSRFIFSARLSR